MEYVVAGGLHREAAASLRREAAVDDVTWRNGTRPHFAIVEVASRPCTCTRDRRTANVHVHDRFVGKVKGPCLSGQAKAVTVAAKSDGLPVVNVEHIQRIRRIHR